MTDKKNVLIVYAHQEPKSFNGALKDVAMETLQSQGHNVEISDLYKMKFDPSASKCAFKELHNEDYFNYQEELKQAAINGRLPDDIKVEIDKILSADLIILQFPLYWLGMPAILKGWLDRCLAEHVAFDIGAMKWFDHGPFTNKKIVLSMTTGGSCGYFSNAGIFGDMNVILWPIHNALRMTGIQILAPQVLYMSDTSHDDRVAMLDSWTSRLHDIWSEKSLSFIHVDSFDPNDEFKLKEGFITSVGDGGDGPTPGQNLGRKLHPESMLNNGIDLQKNRNAV